MVCAGQRNAGRRAVVAADHSDFYSLWLVASGDEQHVVLELGRRIERHQGSLFFLGFVLLSALASNVSQFVFSGPALFGGLSGVLYALLGFCWIYQLLCPVAAYALPKGVVGMMLVWLLVCLFGIVSALGFGEIANAAHVSGLVVGCLVGGLIGLFARMKRNA